MNLRRRLIPAVAIPVVAALCVVAVPLAPAIATERVVTNCNDAGAGSLRQALLDSARDDTVAFALSGSCSRITLASALPDVDHGLTITGPGSANLIIDGVDTHHIFTFTFTNPTDDLAISGLTLEDGKGISVGGSVAAGALWAAVDSINLTDVVVTSSSATGVGAYAYGGGAFIEVQSASTITNSQFTNNTVSSNGSASGAALTVGGIGNVTITNSTFSSNDTSTSGNSSYASGGALKSTTQGRLIVVNSTFSNNSVHATGTADVAQGGALQATLSGSVELTGTTFTDNTITLGSASGAAYGGAVMVLSTPVTVSGGAFSGNSVTSPTQSAIAKGGAVSAWAVSPVTISGSTVWLSNSAQAGTGSSAYGGAIYQDQGDLRISGTQTFANNAAIGGVSPTNSTPGGAFGGAVYAGGLVEIGEGAQFTANMAQGGSLNASLAVNGLSAGGGQGGAVALGGTASVFFTGARFDINLALGGSAQQASDFGRTGLTAGLASGGAVYSVNSGVPVVISNSGFVNNQAVAPPYDADIIPSATLGGAVFSSATTFFFSDLFQGNSATAGQVHSYAGALYLSGATTSVANSTFIGNSSWAGGAVHIAGTTSTLVNDTFMSNTADNGGAVSANNAAGQVALTNSIVSSTGPDNCLASGGAAITTSHSVVQGPTCGTDGGGNVSADPLVEPLADNGGPTRTLALQAGSPALLLADSATCQGNPVDAIDQRGEARPVGYCDAGAYQRSAAPQNNNGGGGGSSSTSTTNETAVTPTSSLTPSETSSPATPATPAATAVTCTVSNVRAVAGDQSIAVSWSGGGDGCVVTAVAMPVSRATPTQAKKCVTSGSSCVIRGLVSGVRYSVSASGGAGLPASAARPLAAARKVVTSTVVQFASGSTQLSAGGRATVARALRGQVVAAKVTGFAAPTSWRRSELASERAAAVRDAAVAARPEVSVRASSSRGVDRRCARVQQRCAILVVARLSTN